MDLTWTSSRRPSDGVSVTALSRHGRQDLVSITQAISRGAVQSWRDVSQILTLLASLNLRCDQVVFGAALGTLAKEREWHDALATLGMMRSAGLRSNLITESATVGACAKSLRWSRACGILHVMRQAQVQPNTIAYNSAITACGARSGSWFRAMQVFEQLRLLGLPAGNMSYNTVISALEYRQQWQRGLSFLEELIQWRLGKLNFATANVVSFNSALSCCRKVSQWQRGLFLLKVPGADDVTYGTAVSACDHAWQWRWALQLLAEADDICRVDVMTLNSAMSACAKVQQWQPCLGLLSDMRHKTVPSKVSFTTALGALTSADTRRSYIGLQLLMEMKQQRIQPNALGYSIGIEACESADLHQTVPELVAGASAAGATACAAAAVSFEEEDRHGDHAGLAIVASDALAWQGRLDLILWQKISRQLCRPAARRLDELCIEPTGSDSFLREPLLERHSSLGEAHTAVVLEMLFAGAQWPCARRSSLDLINVAVSQDPEVAALVNGVAATAIVAWCSAHLKAENSHSTVQRVIGAEAEAASNALHPIFMVHDRSTHAERALLLQLLTLASSLREKCEIMPTPTPAELVLDFCMYREGTRRTFSLLQAHSAALKLEVEETSVALEAAQQEAALWKERAEVMLGRRKAVMQVAARWQGNDAAWEWLMEQGQGAQELDLPEGSELRLQNRELCLSLRQFKQDCELLESENLSLKEAVACMEEDLHRVSDQHARLVGHVNHRQKIRYTMKLKEEINRLCVELKRARQRIVQLEVSKESESLLDALASLVGTPVPRMKLRQGRPGLAAKLRNPVRPKSKGEDEALRLADAEQLCILQQSALDRISMDFQHLKALIERTVMLADTERRNGVEGGNFAALLHRLREIIAANHRTPQGANAELGPLPVAPTSITCDDDDVELAEGQVICYGQREECKEQELE
ncbi:unnamed protein product [Durusdinium trenchii]|uniref:Hyaluronan-mediated motility receptor C-terminal domain-containing protein n=1 Tax=Durusdinium trenchii TaxID=1381693 RepID=A0ABP0PBX2_9DINO